MTPFKFVTTSMDRFKMPPIYSSQQLPKTIYMYWDKGLDSAPDIVKHCHKTWKVRNPAWDVELWTDETVGRLVDTSQFKVQPRKAAFSDILRSKLLTEFGGVWADATTVCVKPLDDWLLPLFNQTEFFAFSQPGDDRLVSSWFLASTKGSDVITKWHKNSIDFWLENDREHYPYYWFHYLFYYGIKTDPTLAKAYAEMPKLNADPCHMLLRMFQGNKKPLDSVAAAMNTYVQKLTYNGVDIQGLVNEKFIVDLK